MRHDTNFKHIDLFSGIGGFSLAVDAVWPNAEHTFCDIDPYARAVIKKHWPEATVHSDIRQFNARSADLVTGGFPCQPFSTAGKQGGKADNRFLWPEMLRIISEAQPTWVIGENVTGIVNLALEQVCTDLEAEGYEVWPLIIPACGLNAPHKRERVWILAHAEHDGRPAVREGAEPRASHEAKARKEGTRHIEAVPPLHRPQLRRWDGWDDTRAKICRVPDGLPRKLVTNRLKGLGNAIVPQVAVEILKLIATDPQTPCKLHRDDGRGRCIDCDEFL
jgi:DNA (cytosine-5)-methyltransferase 1